MPGSQDDLIPCRVTDDLLNSLKKLQTSLSIIQIITTTTTTTLSAKKDPLMGKAHISKIKRHFSLKTNLISFLWC